MKKSLPALFLPWLIGVAVLLSACGKDYEVPTEWMPDDYMPDESGRYGVRWSIYDVDNLGERCFTAAGKRAKIGIGRTNGSSDFDKIFPWSEIRRCNITTAGGTERVVMEGEAGFALDGSNGDVFVRIPKFGYERYVKDGYEYRVITKTGKPHPAFVEDGKEVDAVYVGAFEAFRDADGLHSWADVIPTSNLTPKAFLELARQRGGRYTLYDLRTVDMIFSLFAVEYGCRNSGVVLGYGCSQYKQPMEMRHEGNNWYYQTASVHATNCFTGRYVAENKMSEGSNILICKGSQETVLTYARLTRVEADRGADATRYYFDG